MTHPLTEQEILQWADACRERTGDWPSHTSGIIPDTDGETWSSVNRALRRGKRGLPGGSSLVRLLAEHRSVRNQANLPPLSEEQILAWADAWRERTGDWPHQTSGAIPESDGDTWRIVSAVLRRGTRGLPGGSSLVRLLAAHRGVPDPRTSAKLDVATILTWADAHKEQTGDWPTAKAGAIPGADGETWSIVNFALLQGIRGLPGGSSLARLLAEHRGVRNQANLPPLSEEQILAWADDWRERNGDWPVTTSGLIPDTNAETWVAVHSALRRGTRGLPGGSSLAQLLAEHRGVQLRRVAPKLDVDTILAWADAHKQQTGDWPSVTSGAVLGTEEETWAAVNSALFGGFRGLPSGSSIAKLLAEHRGRPHKSTMRPPLDPDDILAWADAHFERTGDWPTTKSGDIPEAPGENWGIVQSALYCGGRSLEGGYTLAQFLAEHRGVRNRQNLPPLRVDAILEWADAHFQRNGDWPGANSGAIPEAPGDSWSTINYSLGKGQRGLPGGQTLANLLAQQRGVRNIRNSPPLTVEMILDWADHHKEQTGDWPKICSGAILAAPEENWCAVNSALSVGCRGLPGGSSLPRLLHEQRGKRNLTGLAALQISEILQWADAHYERTGDWPDLHSGPVPEALGETWAKVDSSLRGLPGGSSLPQLLGQERGVHRRLTPLTVEQILQWADRHHEQNGAWPTAQSGMIPNTNGETWRSIESSLRIGNRGLPKGSSIARLLQDHRGKQKWTRAAKLNADDVRRWAQAHRQKHGRWPTAQSGPIEEAPGETWSAVFAAFAEGRRGVPKGSLSRFLKGQAPAETQNTDGS